VRTREVLRQALLRLLDLRPFAQIKIGEICDVAKVGYTTFYRHHLTKESLLDDLAAEQMGNLIRMAMSVVDTADTASASLALFSYVDDHRRIWATLLTGGAAGAMRDELLRIARQVAATRARPGKWPPPDIATILIVSSTIELLSWWLQKKKPLTIKQVAEIHERIVIDPVLNAKPVGARKRARH
jgi:AcrR family transcriptional regulator